jgi:dual specificity protein kinase YAK1
LERGKFTPKFYNLIPLDGGGRFHYQMKSKEQWSEENNTKPRPTKRYFPADKRLGEIIQAYPCKKGITPQALDLGTLAPFAISQASRCPHYADHRLTTEKRARLAFVDFIEGLLKIDPTERWTADQASQHPFVTGQPYTGPWTPPPPKQVTPLILPPPFIPAGVGVTARLPPGATVSASSGAPPLSSSLPPASIALNPSGSRSFPFTPTPAPISDLTSFTFFQWRVREDPVRLRWR